MAYAARTKYDEPGRAERYRRRSPRRDAEEWRLLAAALDALPGPVADALDAPCGTGRVAERLLERGLAVRCADLSPAMRAETRARLEGRAGYRGVAALDLETASPDPSLRSDLVVCFRFLHHLPDEATRGRVLRCLARLARRHVLLGFHHPVSVHNLRRRIRALVTGRRSDRHTITVRRLRREAASAGLVLADAFALGAWRRELWVARLDPPRDGEPPPPPRP